MSNIIVGLIILLIISGSVSLIILEKRKGAKCVGCPYNAKEKCSCK